MKDLRSRSNTPATTPNFCCRKLEGTLLADPYLDPEYYNLYVLDGQVYIRLYYDQSVRFDEAANFCPWCGSPLSRSNDDPRGQQVWPRLPLGRGARMSPLGAPIALRGRQTPEDRPSSN